MDLDYLIDRLEELLDRSTRVPLTTRVVIDEDEYLRLIDQMRINVPQEIKNARQVEAERDQVLAAAQAQAEAMIAAAREKAELLTSEHIVLQQAEERANQVLAQAYEEAAAIRADADAYALEVLERIAAQLDGFGRTIQNGIRLLKAGSPVSTPAAAALEVEPHVVGGEHGAAPRA
jgi:F0F1-type ATP synthase membrane subunit b/b'